MKATVFSQAPLIRDRQANGQTDKEPGVGWGGDTHTNTHRETERQTDKEPERGRGRETDRQEPGVQMLFKSQLFFCASVSSSAKSE